MATQTLNTNHDGLQRVLRAAEAFGVFVKAAVVHHFETARVQREWLRIQEMARADNRLMADLRAAKQRAERDE
ncbi:MAG: hypothetical protein QM766_01910 [Burkholderiaceae bacterium]